jgi:hypothetical protein
VRPIKELADHLEALARVSNLSMEGCQACEDASRLLRSLRSVVLEEAAAVCEEQIAVEFKGARLQARVILQRCAASIRALK